MNCHPERSAAKPRDLGFRETRNPYSLRVRKLASATVNPQYDAIRAGGEAAK
jgi:hypothetical protein